MASKRMTASAANRILIAGIYCESRAVVKSVCRHSPTGRCGPRAGEAFGIEVCDQLVTVDELVEAPARK
jgi:hypothetical protein